MTAYHITVDLFLYWQGSQNLVCC